MRTQKRHSRHIPYGTATLGFRKDPRCYRTAKRTMEENTFANAILEQLNDLLDGPWNDCLSDPEDVNAQTSDPEDGGPSPRAGAAGNFRQLAPATVEAGPGPVVCGPRAFVLKLNQMLSEFHIFSRRDALKAPKRPSIVKCLAVKGQPNMHHCSSTTENAPTHNTD